MSIASTSKNGSDGTPRLGRGALEIYRSAKKVEDWVERHNFEGYEPFDGLSSPLRSLTFGIEFLERVLVQAVRQCPINLRPIVGVKPLPSTKGRGFMAAGYLRMYTLTGDPVYRDKAISTLSWLVDNKSPLFEEFSWGNHFDVTFRGGYYAKHESIIVWTSLVGQVFLDAYETLGDPRYLDVADSACRWIVGLPRETTASGTCINYHTRNQDSVHNASMLGAAMLARTWRHTGVPEYLSLSSAAMGYSCAHQLADGAWWYGEAPHYHWIDNFHTGYNLDSLLCYINCTGDHSYASNLEKGFGYYAGTFFDGSGRPRYYSGRAHPIDVQCASQSIETLAKFSGTYAVALPLAKTVAKWTIEHMQDADGYFYYRRYPVVIDRTPMLHWGQATMYSALCHLLGSWDPE